MHGNPCQVMHLDIQVVPAVQSHTSLWSWVERFWKGDNNVKVTESLQVLRFCSSLHNLRAHS